MTTTTFPISLINQMLKADGINNWETSYSQFKWNKFENKHVTRKFFTEEYLETKFNTVIAYLRQRSRCPPVVTQFFLESVNEECNTEILPSFKEFEEKLLWGVTIQFPKKTFRHNCLVGDMNYRFTYSYFENGKGGYNCAFIEDNSCEDSLNDEFIEPMFHRAYVSLNGAFFPFFKEPTTHYIINTGFYVSIKHLNKDLGMVTKIVDKYNCSYYDFTVSKKCVEYYQFQNRWFTYITEKYYMFTKNEREQLHPDYKENENENEYKYESECDL